MPPATASRAREKKVIAVGTIPELLATEHPWIQDYFNGPRGALRQAGTKPDERRFRAAIGKTDGNSLEQRPRRAFVLIFTAALAFFVVWLANDTGGEKREYDIFKQSVDGLNKGAAVQFSGVPSGQVREISLWPEDPQFVRVRIQINEGVPILQGTTAAIEGQVYRRVADFARRRGQGRAPITDLGVSRTTGHPHPRRRAGRVAEHRAAVAATPVDTDRAAGRTGR